jgi:hypothetical protein
VRQKTGKRFPKLSSLLNLLEDDNQEVATMAMEQLLTLDKDLDTVICQNQETLNPKLRQRIHQLTSILQIRHKRSEFLELVQVEEFDLWEALSLLNQLYYPSCDLERLQERVQEVMTQLYAEQPQPNILHVAAFLREANYTTPADVVHDSDAFMVEQAVIARVGDMAVLCVFAQLLCQRIGIETRVVLKDGVFCLFEPGTKRLLDPKDEWSAQLVSSEEPVQPCSARSVVFSVLTRLFSGAVAEGELYEIYYFGKLLSSMCDAELDDIPYPLGDNLVGQPGVKGVL